MVIKFMTFDPDDEYLNNHPGSPPYYGPSCSSFSSSASSTAVGVCNGCLGGIYSVNGALAQPSEPGQRFSSLVQAEQLQNRGRDGNYNFLLKLINRRIRGDDSKSSRKSHGNNWELKGELVLFDDCSWAFGLEDLLRASAKVLPESLRKRYNNASLEDLLRAPADELRERQPHCSTTYMVSLEDSTIVVVKRFKNGNATMTELREHMELLGQIRHENVAPLQGYLISTDESLMLYDYYRQGSAYSAMQGTRRGSLNWETRVKIVIGVVRGIAFIHEQNDGKLFHGNLTSSNVFINSQGYGCVSEIYCNSLKSGESPYSRYDPNMREASQASDIYGLGLLMLKLLFGNNPLRASSVISNKYYDQTDDIYNFDEKLPYWECMLMLNLALGCVTTEPGDRPKIKELVEIVENKFCVMNYISCIQ